MTRLRKLRALVDAAGRVARDPRIVEPLVRSTGLSPANVRLGLSRHLETAATDEELAALERSVTPAERVHVILSPSVFVAPLRAIALGLAASDRVTVKPSRREAFFSRALIEALGDPAVTLAPELSPADVTSGEIHVYGRAETLEAVKATARAPVRGHGPGMGIALVTGDLPTAAKALADDVVPFDQRGCLSPRVAFVVGDASTFARLLFEALESHPVPRGALDEAERSARARWSDTVTFGGTLHPGASSAVGLLDRPLLPPSGRHVLVVPITSPAAMPPLPNVIAVGTDAPVLPREVVPPSARLSMLGEMQRPPLDGPVDGR